MRTTPPMLRPDVIPARARRSRAPLAALAALAGLVGIAAAVAVPSGATAAIADLPDPVAAYPLTTDASDSVGTADGTAVGAVTFGTEGATLPGGSASTTDYVELPGDTFEGRDEFTVSIWVKASTGSGNYSAMFVGTEPQGTDNIPVNYWLLNPRNPSGNFKTVVTDGSSTTAPWGTEVGPAGPSSVSHNGVWTQYTTVISDDAITGYVNGENIGSASRSIAFSSFGTELDAYLGRSNYLADQTWAGSLLDLRVYGSALDDATVADVFADAQDAPTQAVVAAEGAAALDLGNTGNVTDDLTLPTAGEFETTIAWSSSNEAVVSNTGEVTLGASPETVTLTATVTAAGGATATRDFVLNLPAQPADAAEVAASLLLPFVLAGGDTLPTARLGADITWASSDTALVTNAGDVVGSVSGLEPVTLTATVALDSSTATREFSLMVAEMDPAYASGYARNPGGPLNSSMHLSLSYDGLSYEALNLNQGVLFAGADFDAEPVNGVAKELADPSIFRMEDGSFGVVATRTNENGAADALADSSVLLFTSDDLVSFTEVGLVDLGTELTVSDPAVVFDGAEGEYLIGWEGSDGGSYVSATADFETVSAAEPGVIPTRAATAPAASGAQAGEAVVLTASEADVLDRRFSRVVNTTVDEPGATAVAYGDEVPNDLGDVTAHYTDGSSAPVPVDWDQAEIDAIDTTQPGTYEVTGDVRAADYPFPMTGEQLADPQVFLFEGSYYLIATNEQGIAPPGGSGRGQAGLFIRKADTIEGLATAPRNWILTDTTNLAWAPEVHQIDGDWYLNWARGGAWNQVKATVVKLNEGGDPAVQADWDWANAEEVVRSDGSSIQPDGITLDMTYFEVGGTWYTMWSDRPITPVTGTADMKIATIDPADPTRLTSDPVTVIRPHYSWERYSTEVVEGPYALIRDGKIVVSFSGNGVDTTYAVGQLEADLDADLLDPASWSRTNAPLLNSANIAGQAGPGHNAYLTDEHGQLLTAIHARNGSGRNATVRVAHWGAFGNLVLDMTPDRHVLPENRVVTAQVIVGEGPDVEFVDVTEHSSEFYDEIMWLASQGITQGWETENGTEFRPCNAITRDAMAAFLYRLADEPA
ncbi:immunoglobulin-like domain-containing protein [Demequina sp. SO4-13]|uniref:immunoglobulin-like domain-containing protein n=1 Tax=Demequina sp. SO4-13 TaxID=3401027 RepID=UPI003AF75D15